MTSPVIDVHAHMVVPRLDDLTRSDPRRAAEQRRHREGFGLESTTRNARLAASTWLGPLTDPSVRLAYMDDAGVDIQLVSTSPAQYFPWAPARLADSLALVANDALADLLAAAPDRLYAMAWVSLQHPELAAGQLRTAMERTGFAGAQIPTRAGRRELSDPALDVFWDAAQECSALLLLHPWSSTLGARLDRFYLNNVVGNPVETTVALSHMVFGGVLDRFPGVNLVAAHGGGYFPLYPGRADHAFDVRPESHTTLELPSHYASRIFYDTLVYNRRQLEALGDAVGTNRLMLGTDYPFDMSDPDGVRNVLRLDSLTPAERDAVLGGTVQSFLPR